MSLRSLLGWSSGETTKITAEHSSQGTTRSYGTTTFHGIRLQSPRSGNARWKSLRDCQTSGSCLALRRNGQLSGRPRILAALKRSSHDLPGLVLSETSRMLRSSFSASRSSFGTLGEGMDLVRELPGNLSSRVASALRPKPNPQRAFSVLLVLPVLLYMNEDDLITIPTVTPDSNGIMP